ncbi:ABC transporter permease [Parafrankia discariae]|uniref:ABC transporter permease n=1 Tax=Parafrankia discariae TaxID=365528 RepID=UPI000378BEBA|nr:ABC transporter permease [Parafrankia discariae]
MNPAGPLVRVVLAGVGRRRAQASVVALTALLAVTASVLALGLLAGSRAPFDRAFAAQRGAHLTVQFDATKATAAQLAATGSATPVARAAGPFPLAELRPRIVSGAPGLPVGLGLPPMTVVGRDRPGGGPDSIDQVAVVEGRWATGQGEIVLDPENLPPSLLGARLELPDLPGAPALTVVGLAHSTGGSARAWVAADALAALVPGDGPAGFQMLYRLTAAGTEGAIDSGRAAISAGVPAGAVTGSRSYLDVRAGALVRTAVFTPFVAAFGVLGLAMSVLIVGTVVAGGVGATIWRTGVLRSLGLTPAQAAGAHVAQVLVPATGGVGLGILCGNLLAQVVFDESASAYGAVTPSVPLWVDAAVGAGALVLVAVAALLPALHAGRRSPVEAMRLGRVPRPGRGRWAGRLAARLPLPRPLSLGLAHPFARPARSGVLAVAVAFGAMGVSFAVGLAATLDSITTDNSRDEAGAVVVDNHVQVEHDRSPGAAAPVPVPAPAQAPARAPAAVDGAAVAVQAADVAKVIAAQPGTGRFFTSASAEVRALGIVGPVTVTAHTGDSSWGARPLIAGHWFRGPGEVVADTRLLDETGAGIGDTVTVSANGASVVLRIVGEVFDLDDDTVDLATDEASLRGLDLGLVPDSFSIDLRPGTDLVRYVDTLRAALASHSVEVRANTGEGSEVIAIMDALIATLTLLLVVVAGLGVLNTVVLDTRERVHDLGIVKAIGMTPRQVLAMVLTSAAGIGACAAAVGVPAGVALHHRVVPLMGNAARTDMPRTYIDVYAPVPVALLLLGGLLIAVLGALAPAGWAAGTRATTALRAE